MLACLVISLGLAVLSPVLYRVAGRATGWAIGFVLLLVAGRLLLYLPSIAGGEAISISIAWVPALGATFALRLDGLSLLFALLIVIIGAVVGVYASGYLHGHPLLGRFYAYTLGFMGSMLGLVLSDNLLLLFVFWELTSLTSYLLIGFNNEQPSARAAALQALLVTSGGGLALLAGFLLLGAAGGSLEMTELLTRADAVRSHWLYGGILGLTLVGAFTKSAQFPFHFWLPNAMEAPTPVSAYLHSATMVKAGVYLLARLSPVLGGTDAWFYALVSAGGITMVLGACLALFNTDLKRILAYTTICLLGALVLLLGVGSKYAVQAAVTLVLAHALYKAPLFLVAGAIDHETGTRDVGRLGGLGRAMPVTATTSVLAALSHAGLPLLFGYIGKELLYGGLLPVERGMRVLLAAAIISNALLFAISLIVGIRPFFGSRELLARQPHEAPISMWLGPLALAVAGLVVGIAPGTMNGLLGASASAVLAQTVPLELSLWHGFNTVLFLSLLTIAAGLSVYLWRSRVKAAFGSMAFLGRWGPARGYEAGLGLLNWVAREQTRVLQSGYLRFYVTIIVLSISGVTLFTLLRYESLPRIRWEPVAIFQLVVTGLIVAGTVMILVVRSRLAAVAALGVVGYGVAVLFILYGAPDLAMTQFAIETVTVILFVLVFYRLPKFVHYSNASSRFRDAVVAVSMGASMTLLMLLALGGSMESQLAPFFAENSLPAAHGRNIVNVILVDFRALDTMGEITVLSVAAIGVFALMKLRLREGEGS